MKKLMLIMLMVGALATTALGTPTVTITRTAGCDHGAGHTDGYDNSDSRVLQRQRWRVHRGPIAWARLGVASI